MRELHEVLERAAAVPTRPLDRDRIAQRALRRRMRRRSLGAAGAVVVGLVLAVAVGRFAGDDGKRVVATEPGAESSALASGETAGIAWEVRRVWGGAIELRHDLGSLAGPAEVPDDRVTAFWGLAGNDPQVLMAFVRPDAVVVGVVLDSGEEMLMDVREDTGLPVNFLVVELPRAARVRGFVAYDRGPGICPPVATESTEGGELTVRVPNLVGKTLEEGRRGVTKAGLRVIGTGAYERDPQAPTAVILAQEPPAGERVPWGSCVGFRTSAPG